ncbi:MAG: hypothetical protein AAF500_07510 [Myxococcota bacterium]
MSVIDVGKTQLLTVVTDEWDAFRAEIRRYSRNPGEPWIEVGPPIAAVIGREGYGWGRGLHGIGRPKGQEGPSKREGDGRSPAGVFAIGEAYGYAPAIEGLSLPYTKATPALRCVDDPASQHYNRIVDERETDEDWKSAEHMRREDDLYAITIVVEHNTRQREPGEGSCIFIHSWIDENTGMSGCTAMAASSLEAVATWLEPDAAVLVALPRDQYQDLRTRWSLP